MLVEDYHLDGIDYNWEYPGYRLDIKIKQEANKPPCPGWVLVTWKRKKFWKTMRAWLPYWGKPNYSSKSLAEWSQWPIILTQGRFKYISDVWIDFTLRPRQESLLALVDAVSHVDLIHSMSYDQGGAQHSPRSKPDILLLDVWHICSNPGSSLKKQ